MQRSQQSQAHSQAPQDDGSKRQAAREVIDILYDISLLLNTNLDRTQLSLCVSLIENGVNPEALAGVIKMLREQTSTSNRNGAATVAGSGSGAGSGNGTNGEGGVDVVRRTL